MGNSTSISVPCTQEALAPSPDSPSPCLFSSPEDRSLLQNVGIFAGAYLPVVFGAGPLFTYLFTGSLQRVVEFYKGPAMWVSTLNCIVWLFYSLVVVHKFSLLELTLSFSFIIILNLSCLLVSYGYTGKKLNIAFLFYAVIWPTELPIRMQTPLSGLGLLLVLVCHVCQISDINELVSLLDKMVLSFNLILYLASNCVTLYITWRWHNDQLYILVASQINCICLTIELLLFIKKAFRDHFFGVGPGNGPTDRQDDLPPPPISITKTMMILKTMALAMVATEGPDLLAQVKNLPTSLPGFICYWNWYDIAYRDNNNPDDPEDDGPDNGSNGRTGSSPSVAVLGRPPRVSIVSNSSEGVTVDVEDLEAGSEMLRQESTDLEADVFYADKVARTNGNDHNLEADVFYADKIARTNENDHRLKAADAALDKDTYQLEIAQKTNDGLKGADGALNNDTYQLEIARQTKDGHEDHVYGKAKEKFGRTKETVDVIQQGCPASSSPTSIWKGFFSLFTRAEGSKNSTDSVKTKHQDVILQQRIVPVVSVSCGVPRQRRIFGRDRGLVVTKMVVGRGRSTWQA